MDPKRGTTQDELAEAMALLQEAVDMRRRATPDTDEYQEARLIEERLNKRVMDVARRRNRTAVEDDGSGGSGLL